MSVSKSLAELRAEHNMSQRDLAQELGVSSATIGMYESGKRTPPLKKAILIAKLFNTQVENILFSNPNYTMEGGLRKWQI